MHNYSNIFDKDGMSYIQYRLLIDELLKQGKTTGPDNAEALLHYSKMNVQRMSRLDKTVVLQDQLTDVLKHLKREYKLLVITEGWCGDAAQIVPVINKIVSVVPDKLELRFVLRDQHPDLINEYLTNSGKAIPVLLVMNPQGDLLFPKWGPRPAILQSLLKEWRQENLEMPVLAERLHGWYARDKTETTQGEFLEIFDRMM